MANLNQSRSELIFASEYLLKGWGGGWGAVAGMWGKMSLEGSEF